jgi:dTDP-4-dehydrorhamnose reductase
MKVPIDQLGNPTHAGNLADVVIDLTLADCTGVFNVCGPERVSRYDFAVAVAEIFGLDAHLLQPVATEELSQAARRPLNAGMVITKVKQAINADPWQYRQGLLNMHASALLA